MPHPETHVHILVPEVRYFSVHKPKVSRKAKLKSRSRILKLKFVSLLFWYENI
jgi:hypothetical protein